VRIYNYFIAVLVSVFILVQSYELQAEKRVFRKSDYGKLERWLAYDGDDMAYGGFRRGRGPEGRKGRWGKPHGRGMAANFLSELNLNDEQKKELSKLQKENRRNMYRIRSKERDLNFELGELLTDENLKEKEINKIIDGLSKNKKDELSARVTLIKNMRKILTKEQLEKVNFNLLWGRGRGIGGGGHHGKGHGRGPGLR